MRILVVEDDPALGAAVRGYLTRESYAVDLVASIGAARACIPSGYAVVVLDLCLPDGSGLSLLPVCTKRAEAPAVLILTALDRLSDRVRGLDAGADDYLVKPFDLPELAARVRALARRRIGRRSPRIEVGPLAIDLATREVRLAGEHVDLTAHEFALVIELAQSPGHVLTRQQLEDAIYTVDEGALSNVVEVYVSRLRRKLGRDAIRTVRGFGYQWGAAGHSAPESGR
jgi:DNA-binding response OmpR family regulator